jgi:hypothetical protein
MEQLRSVLARRTLPLLAALLCVMAASGALPGVQADTNSPSGADQPPPTTDQLPPPTGLSATSDQTSIKLTWNPVPGARYYDLYRDRSISGVVSAPVTTFTFTGLKCATSHRLEVDARNDFARSPPAELTASTSACTDPPARVPSISGFTPTSGPVGTSVTVSGSAFSGATAVKFNGTSAKYTVSSDTQISATVPAGATSGPIAVTGPAGTGQSSSSFTVTAGSSSLYLSPSGLDKNACTSSAPCLTFQRAYQLSAPGAVVQVTCGGRASCSYPSQTLPYTLAKGGAYRCRAAESFPDGISTAADISGCVTYQPASGTSPTIADISVEVPFVQLNGLTFTRSVFAGTNLGRTNAPCSAWNVHDVVFRNLTAASFTIDDASYTYFVGGRYGPLLDQASHVSGCKDSTGAYSQGDHLAFDGITMHDYRQTKYGTHMECIHFQAADNSVIVKSKFLNCAQQDLSVQTNLGVSTINGLTIENNVFDAACSHAQPGDACGVVSGGTTTFICSNTGEKLANVVMRFNSLNGSPSFQDQQSCSMSKLTVEGNILQGPPSAWSCSAIQAVGVTFRYNAFTNTSGVACGIGNVLGAIPSKTWLDPANYDYSLKSTSLAVDLTPMSLPHPATDIAGTSRPQQISPDAGAYEYP